jgi:hypothetical protein
MTNDSTAHSHPVNRLFRYCIKGDIGEGRETRGSAEVGHLSDAIRGGAIHSF